MEKIIKAINELANNSYDVTMKIDASFISACIAEAQAQKASFVKKYGMDWTFFANDKEIKILFHPVNSTSILYSSIIIDAKYAIQEILTPKQQGVKFGWLK